MKYENMRLYEFCDLVYDGKINSEHEMYEFIKYITKGYDKIEYKYFVNDFRGYANEIKFEPQKDFQLLIRSPHFTNDKTLNECIDFLKIKFPDGVFKCLSGLCKFSDIVEQFEIIETNQSEIIAPEPISKDIKRPHNTHNIQFALLERLGIVDYLKKEYNLPDTKMSELIANILNKDIQNTREMLMLTGTKNKESNLPKNQKGLNDIFIKTGVIEKD
jgi:hypothetical protein